MNSIDCISFLKSSPMFQMSLGSKELFHSNFLKWLFETYPTSIQILNLQKIDNEEFEVLAERKHMDLVICSKKDKNKVFAVIENKFKDVPNKAQLKRYFSSEPKAENYILLSLVPPAFEANDWSHVSYKNLGDELQKWATDLGTFKSERDKEFISEYIKMVHCVDQIATEQVNSSDDTNPYWFGEQDFSKLDEIRFSDTIKKHLGQIMAATIETRLRKEYPDLKINPISPPKNANMAIWVHNSLANKTPCVTVHVGRLDEPKVNLFIQIQGHQYRHMVVWYGFKIKENKGDDLAKYRVEAIETTDDGRWLFSKVVSSDSPVRKNHEFNNTTYQTSARMHFNSYSPGNIYQYINIENPSKTEKAKDSHRTLNYRNIVDIIIKDTEQAINLLKDPTYIEKFNKSKRST